MAALSEGLFFPTYSNAIPALEPHWAQSSPSAGHLQGRELLCGLRWPDIVGRFSQNFEKARAVCDSPGL